MPVILANQAEIRKIALVNSSGDPISKKKKKKKKPQKRAGRVAQGAGPEIKFHTTKKNCL
jgi:hypothetical protein